MTEEEKEEEDQVVIRVAEMSKQLKKLRTENEQLQEYIRRLCVAAGGPKDGKEIQCMIHINRLVGAIHEWAQQNSSSHPMWKAEKHNQQLFDIAENTENPLELLVRGLPNCDKETS